MIRMSGLKTRHTQPPAWSGTAPTRGEEEQNEAGAHDRDGEADPQRGVGRPAERLLQRLRLRLQPLAVFEVVAALQAQYRARLHRLFTLGTTLATRHDRGP